MNEFQAALGLLQLKHVDGAIAVEIAQHGNQAVEDRRVRQAVGDEGPRCAVVDSRPQDHFGDAVVVQVVDRGRIPDLIGRGKVDGIGLDRPS